MNRLGFLVLALLLAWLPADANMLMAPTGGGGPVPVVIHYTEGVESGGCTTTCNITVPSTTAGNAYLVIISDYGNSAAPTTGVHIGSDACSEVSNSGNIPDSGHMGVLFFLCTNITGGSTTASYTTGSTGALLFDAYEISGVALSSAYDTAAGNYNGSGNSVTCSLGPTTQTDELIIVSGQGSGSSAWSSPTSPWGAPIISGGSPWTFSQTGAALATYSATVTATSATEQACAILGIKHP